MRTTVANIAESANNMKDILKKFNNCLVSYAYARECQLTTAASNPTV